MEKEFFFIFPFFSFFLSFFFVLLFNARMSVASSGMETKMATIMPPLLQPSAECGATRPFLPTTASIRRCAIWSTTAYKKSRLSHRSRLPRRRVLRWTAPHRAALSSSPKLYALTMTTILLKGKFQTIWMLFKIIHPHVCPDVVPSIFFLFRLIWFSDQLRLSVDSIRLCLLPQSAVVVFKAAYAKRPSWRTDVDQLSVLGRGTGSSYRLPICFFTKPNIFEGN